MSLSILVVDDEKINRVTRTRQLSDAGYEVEGHETPFTALEALERKAWDVVITDLRMPAMDGIELLKKIRSRSPETSVLLMTAYGTVKKAVESLQLGAEDFLTKPFDIDELKVRLKRIEDERRLRREVNALREMVGTAPSHEGMVGSSQAMRRIAEQVEQFAPTSSNVLIVGEIGAGRDTVARALHLKSGRRHGPFVPLACATLPKDLAEIDLFGQEPPVSSALGKLRRGRIELAAGGTLYLGDIDEFPLEAQARLLRAIEEKQFERVGSHRTLTADVRIIASAKEGMESLAESGRFRRDLFYRLHSLVIRVPPLRERREDILSIAHHLLGLIARERGGTPKHLAHEAAERLLRHDWPGNVRELRHAMEYAHTLSRESEIEPDDLPINVTSIDKAHPYSLNVGSLERVDFRLVMENFERDMVRWALGRARGNQVKAAEILGIPRTTLLSKLEAWRDL